MKKKKKFLISLCVLLVFVPQKTSIEMDVNFQFYSQLTYADTPNARLLPERMTRESRREATERGHARR